MVYDDTASLYAARTWWSLRVYGLDSVRILDGGFAAWTESGRPVSHAVPEPPRGGFTPRAQMRLRLMAERREVARRVAGRALPRRADAGRVPRLRRRAASASATSRARSTSPSPPRPSPGPAASSTATSLRELLAQAGVTRDRRIVCYDGAGVGAAKLAFVLALMGHEDVAVYDGGWAEWGNRLDLPIER